MSFQDVTMIVMTLSWSRTKDASYKVAVFAWLPGKLLIC